MLNASKDFFAKGAFRAQLDRYLIHLQRYALAKRSLHQLPPHAEFLLMDTFESLRPDMEIFDSISEANAAVAKIHAKDPEVKRRQWLSAEEVVEEQEEEEEEEEEEEIS